MPRSPGPAGNRNLLKNCEVNGVGHGLIAKIVGMETVFRREARQQSAGMLRIAHNRVEIDHAIKRAASPDPFINRLPSRFLGFRVVARKVHTFKRSDRSANDLDSVSVSAGNQLAVSVDDLLWSANIRRIGKEATAQLCAGETNVVDPFKQHNVSNAWQREGVAVEASQGADTEAADAGDEAVTQQAVTDYALIDHRHVQSCGRLSQTTDEIARPIVVRLHGGPIPVGDRVAKRDRQALRRLSRNEHSPERDGRPRHRASFYLFRSSIVAMLRDHGAFERERMQRRSSDAFWKIETDADLGSGSDGKGHRITEYRRPRRDRDRMAAPEGDRMNRARPDARRVGGCRNRHRADQQG